MAITLYKPRTACECGSDKTRREKYPERWVCLGCDQVRATKKRKQEVWRNGKKFCAACGDFRPPNEFYPRRDLPKKDGTFGLSSLCIKHTKEEASQYRSSEKGRSSVQAGIRRSHAKRLAAFGAAREDYKPTLDAQGGGCALCGRTEADGRWGTFNFDHDHETNVFRGLLCCRCNRLVAAMGDTFTAAAPLMDYLLRGLRNGDAAEYAADAASFIATGPTAEEWLARWRSFIASPRPRGRRSRH